MENEIIILKDRTKENLKKIDEAIKKQTEETQSLIEKHNAVLQYFNKQKSDLLSGILTERDDVKIDSKYQLDENYDIKLISEEEFEKLTKQPGASVIESNVKKE